MSRSGYSDDYDDRVLHLYRGRVASALRGRRGQAFLKDLLAQLDAMPEKRLITGELEEDGQVCTLGVITRARAIDTSKLKFDDMDETDVIDQLVKKLDIAAPMVREIMFENDEGAGYWKSETPEQRFVRMRIWVESHIAK